MHTKHITQPGLQGTTWDCEVRLNIVIGRTSLPDIQQVW